MKEFEELDGEILEYAETYNDDVEELSDEEMEEVEGGAVTESLSKKVKKAYNAGSLTVTCGGSNPYKGNGSCKCKYNLKKSQGAFLSHLRIYSDGKNVSMPHRSGTWSANGISGTYTIPENSGKLVIYKGGKIANNKYGKISGGTFLISFDLL